MAKGSSKVLGIPAAALWGAVWGPGALSLALIGAWPRAIVLAIWGTFVVSGLEYPNAALPGADSYFYWEKVDFGLKPTIRLNHAVTLTVR